MALPHLQLFKLDFSDLFCASPNPAAWSAVLAYTLVMVFDVGGAMFGLGNLAGLVRGGNVPGAVVTYLAAAAGTAIGAFIGTTPLIIAAESAVGIKEGGRTGLVSITVGGCFLLSMFLAPFLRVSEAETVCCHVLCCVLCVLCFVSSGMKPVQVHGVAHTKRRL